MAFLWLRSRANQKPHKANSSSTRRALCAKRERHGGGACEFDLKIRSVACGISNAHGRKSRYRDTGRALLWYAVVSTGSPAAAGGARASPRRLLATGCAGGGRPNARTRGARCVLTTRRDGADRARRDGVDHGRRDGADRARRDGHRPPPRQRRATVVRPRPPGPGVRLRLRGRLVPSPGGRKFSWCFSGWAERPWRYPSW